jgi:kinesin family protein C2/C3
MQCNSCSTVTGLRNCLNVGTLRCPKCIHFHVKKELSVFCSQKCFRDSYSEHKILHANAKKTSTFSTSSLTHSSSSPTRVSSSPSSSLQNEEEKKEKERRRKRSEEIGQEADITQQEIELLSQKLVAAQDQITGQGNQCQDYERIIQELKDEVCILREEAKGESLTSITNEKEEDKLRKNLVNEVKRVAEFQQKLDLAESESKAAVSLLRSRDEEIENLRQETKEELQKNEFTWKTQVEKLQLDLEELRQNLNDCESQKIKASDQHKLDLKSVEEAIRNETMEACKEEAAATLAKVEAESQVALQTAVEEVAADTRLGCKNDELLALQSLRDELKTESVNALKHCTEEHNNSMKELRSQAFADKEQALALQKSSLTEVHDNLVKTLTATHAKLEQEAADHLIEVKKDAENAAIVVEKTHKDELSKMSQSYAALEQKIKDIEKQQQEEIESALAACRREAEDHQVQAVNAAREEMQSMVDQAMADREEYLQLYTKESKSRKAIHNKLMDMQGNIRVMCRVRPVLDVEKKQAKGEDVNATEILSDEDIVLHRDQFTKHSYEFDKIFPPGGTQAGVFDAVQPLIVSVLDGYNVCIFAYGQTGSGKTYTMEGYGDAPEDKGVAPRAIHDLFLFIQKAAENWAYTVAFSMLEIYNETIRDLLVEPTIGGGVREAATKLDIRQTPTGNEVTGLTKVVVCNSGDVLDLMSRGQSNRAVGAHDMNEHSSRSHSILTLTVSGVNNKDSSTTYGKLHLIDLAGSERVGKTDATGDRLKEAQNINRSLSALGDVINSLGGKKSSHIPYRNSKLTFLLQDSLGGNSKVMMFVNISPATYNVNESICSLNFALRCRNVELGQAKKQVGTGKEKGSTVSTTASSSTLRRASTTVGTTRRPSSSTSGSLRK